MDWTDAVVSELDRLRGLQHEHKRRNTILALVDARPVPYTHLTLPTKA